MAVKMLTGAAVAILLHKSMAHNMLNLAINVMPMLDLGYRGETSNLELEINTLNTFLENPRKLAQVHTITRVLFRRDLAALGLLKAELGFATGWNCAQVFIHGRIAWGALPSRGERQRVCAEVLRWVWRCSCRLGPG